MNYNHGIFFSVWLCLLQPLSVQAFTAVDQLPREPISRDQNISRAKDLLRQSCHFYRHLDSISGRVTTDLCLQSAVKTTHKRDTARFKFERSKYLRIKMMGPKRAGQVVLNGLSAHFYSLKWQTYVDQSLASMEQVFKDPDFNFITDGALKTALLPEFLSDDPYAELLKNRTIKSYDGLDIVDGKKCHRITLSMNGASSDAQIWLQTGNKPWIKKFMPMHGPMTILPVPVPPPPLTEITMTSTYATLKANPKVRISGFKPPSTAKQASHFVASSDGDARQSLVGTVAPEIKVRTVGGDIFDLRRHRDQVIVAEFWTTWCGPCCRALPVLAEVTKSFSSHRVQLIAINEKENPAKISAFLRDKSVSVKVGLDSGEIAERYHVVGIPQTVVIGHNGIIKSIHVGFTPDVAEQVRKELQTLVLGNEMTAN